jgi:hypothetical protein
MTTAERDTLLGTFGFCVTSAAAAAKGVRRFPVEFVRRSCESGNLVLVSPALWRLAQLKSVRLRFVNPGTNVLFREGRADSEGGETWRLASEGTALVAECATRGVCSLSRSAMEVLLGERAMSLEALRADLQGRSSELGAISEGIGDVVATLRHNRARGGVVVRCALDPAAGLSVRQSDEICLALLALVRRLP